MRKIFPALIATLLAPAAAWSEEPAPRPSASPSAIPSPAPSPRGAPGVGQSLIQGGGLLHAGVMAAGNSAGDYAVAPGAGFSLNGFDLTSSIHVDVNLRAGFGAAGYSNRGGFGASGVDAGLRFVMAWVPGEGRCRFRLGGGVTGEYRSMSGPGSEGADGEKIPGHTVSARNGFSPVRLETGALCTDGNTTVVIGPYAAATMLLDDKTLRPLAEAGVITRIFVSDTVLAEAQVSTGQPLAQGAPRIYDARLGGDFMIHRTSHGGVFLGGDVSVTRRIDPVPNAPDSATSGLGAGGSVRASVLF